MHIACGDITVYDCFQQFVSNKYINGMKGVFLFTNMYFFFLASFTGIYVYIDLPNVDW